MSVTRQLNLLDGLRLEIPHLRSLESSIVHDLEAVSGRLLGGGRSWVVSGFTIPPTAIGRHHSDLVLDVAGGLVSHYRASERGTVLAVPPDRTSDPLNDTNGRVTGTFLVGGINHIGLDLIRAADPDSATTATFQDPNTREEFSRIVPMARTLDYRIVISPQAFAASPNLLPIARVELDLAGRVTRIWDCRPMLFGLAGGGDAYDPVRPFAWPWGRTAPAIETTTVLKDPFRTADKGLTSAKDWSDAVMTRIWELGGGEWWGAPTSDRDVKVAYGANDRQGTYLDYSNKTADFTIGAAITNGSGASGMVRAIIDRGATGTLVLSGVQGTFAVGQTITGENGGSAKVASNLVACDQNWSFRSADGTFRCHWAGVSVLFANSTATHNIVRDSVVTYGAGGVEFPDGYVLYVDVDRGTDGAEIVPALKPASALGLPATPGSRFILAWRNGSRLFARDVPYNVGRPTQIPIGSANEFGIVRAYDLDAEIWSPDTPEFIGTNAFNAPYGVPMLDATGNRLKSALLGSEANWDVGGDLSVQGLSNFTKAEADEFVSNNYKLPEIRTRRLWESPRPIFVSMPGITIAREATGISLTLIGIQETPSDWLYFDIPCPPEGREIHQVLLYMGLINVASDLPLTVDVNIYGLWGDGQAEVLKQTSYFTDKESSGLIYPPDPEDTSLREIAFDVGGTIEPPTKTTPLYGVVLGLRISGSDKCGVKVMRIGSSYRYQNLAEV